MSDRISDLKELDDSSQDQDDESDENDDEQPAEAESDDAPEPDESESAAETEPSPDPDPDPENAPDDGDESGGESETDGEPDAEPETETESTPSMNTTEDDDAVNQPAEDSVSDDPSETEPAFSGDDYQQHTIYSTEETWHDYTDTMDQMDLMIFRQQFDVRNVTVRERNEAMVRLARDHPELIAERVLEARGHDVDLSDE